MPYKTQQFIATAKDVGRRLDIVVAEHFGVSRSSLSLAYRDGSLLLNGTAAKARTLLQTGDIVDLRITPFQKVHFGAPDLLKVYEDNDLVIIEKPAGLSVHATEHGKQEVTVADFGATVSSDNEDLGRPGIVHRLDKDTSGLLIIAKTFEAKQSLQQKFRDREVDKQYLALVRGRLNEPVATINLPIGRDRKRPTRRTVLPGGRPAVTHYRALAEYPGATLVEVTLETGRTHQIRVHFAHLGHPVVGDSLYGAAQSGLPRQFLHAARLKLTGPHGQKIDVASLLPNDLRQYLETLGMVPEGV